MTARHQLTVVSLKADTIDTSTIEGPPSIVIGGWVEVVATNGEVSATQLVHLEHAPHLGDSITVDIEEA